MKYKKTITVLVILLLILSGLMVYKEYFKESIEEEICEEKEEFVLDDRISPQVNQGFSIEMLRIRHRGLLDKIMKTGNSYKEKPIFYYICKVGDIEVNSKIIDCPIGKTTNYYNDWDTMFKEKTIKFDVEEEQETVDITISLMEQVKNGILGLRNKDIEQERIQLRYDFRTGRWDGDDSLKDKDGYGHYVGETFELWFNIYQFDYDHDGIPYWTEVNVLRTDPQDNDRLNDPDGDGVSTFWEWKWEYDPFTWNDHKNLDPDIDGIQNLEEYKMEKYFANPFQPDIYIEGDGMKKGGIFDWEHRLFEETAQIVIERYCQHNINVYIDYGWPTESNIGGGESLPYEYIMDQDSNSPFKFYQHHLSDDRKGIFRYMIIGDIAGYCFPSTFNAYGTLTIPTNLKTYLKTGAITPRLMILQEAIAILHELGHSVGIKPWTIGGCDNRSYFNNLKAKKEYKETWGNYESVMNYYYFLDRKLVDYSDGSNGPPYDQNDWDHLFLPTFELECAEIEGATIWPEDLIQVHKNVTIEKEGYEFNSSLTEKFSLELKELAFVRNADVDFQIYLETGEEEEKNILVYGLPKVYPTQTIWSLVSEGKLNEKGELSFYSQEKIINEVT